MSELKHEKREQHRGKSCLAVVLFCEPIDEFSLNPDV
jgi:hypothetical protein